jgi:1-acyl-sn-glycerol-3-phosphate acyltransferase
MKKIFYASIRFIFSKYNFFYFRNFKVIGKENIPKNGAVLFSPNHQNALLDPLLVGTTAGRSVHSLTRSDVFGGPLQWFLDAMQTIPVYRIRDGYDKLKNNQKVFEHCYALLAQKKHLMMFSEGKHHDQYYLLRLSKGSSRLAIEAQLRSPRHPIYLQPVGINYGNHLHARHDCTVVYGKPINVQDYLSSYQDHPAKGLNALRDALQLEMEACLWYPKNDENYTAKKQFINRKNTIQAFQALKAELEKSSPVLKAASKNLLIYKGAVILFSLPNLPVHLALKHIIGRFEDHVFHASVKYFGGLMFFLLWEAVGVSVVTSLVNFYWGVSFFLLSLFSVFVRQYFITRSL